MLIKKVFAPMFLEILNKLVIYKKYDRQLVKNINDIKAERDVCVCLVTKPLQYMNLKAIELESSCCNVLIVVNSFIDAEKFVCNIRRKDNVWDEIFFVETEFVAQGTILRLSNISTFWLPCDCGVKTNFFMKELWQRGVAIKLIEEGYGNYLNSGLSFEMFHPFLAKHSFLSKYFFLLIRDIFRKLSGCGQWMNCSKWLSEVHLYYPDYPKLPCRDRKILCQLPLSPQDNFIRLSDFFDLSSCTWLSEFKHKKILFINVSWDGIASFSQSDLAKYDKIIIKYHPHLKNKKSEQDGKCNYVAENIPSEILIFKLLSQDCDVTLRSCFSSTMIYLQGTSVKFEFSNQIPDFFVDFWNFVKRKYNTSID